LAAYHFSQTFKNCKYKVKRVRRRETSVKRSKEKSGLWSNFFWPVSRVSGTGAIIIVIIKYYVEAVPGFDA